MDTNKMSEGAKVRDFIKQQQQLKAMKPSPGNKVLSADKMINDLLSKKEIFQKRNEAATSHSNPSNVKLQQHQQQPFVGCPPWLNPESGQTHPLYNKIWQLCKLETAQIQHPTGGVTDHNRTDLTDTTFVSRLLMTSGLTADQLAYVWSLCNNTIPGILTLPELYQVVALVALSQSGYAYNSVMVLNQLAQPPIPKLDLLAIQQLKQQQTGLINSPTSIVASIPNSLNNNNKVNDVSSPGAVIPSPSVIFSNYQTGNTNLRSSVNGLASLDVNQLQATQFLTNVPSSVNVNYNNTAVSTLSSASNTSVGGLSYSIQQQQVGNVPISSTSSGIEVQTTTTGNNVTTSLINDNSNVVNTVIPSISLDLSNTQKREILHNANGTPVSAENLSRAGSHIFSNIDHSNGVYENFSQLNEIKKNNIHKNVKNDSSKFKSSSTVTNDTKANIYIVGKTSHSELFSTISSDSIDESFDSLCSERAMMTGNHGDSNNSIGVNTSKQEKQQPNYDIDLFNSFDDVKSIFPHSGFSKKKSDNKLITKGENEAISVESSVTNIGNNFVMHNPIYSDDLNTSTGNKSRIENAAVVTNADTDNEFDDEFSDFQSANFCNENIMTAKYGEHEKFTAKQDGSRQKIKITENLSNNDLYYNDFQQANSTDFINTVTIEDCQDNVANLECASSMNNSDNFLNGETIDLKLNFPTIQNIMLNDGGKVVQKLQENNKLTTDTYSKGFKQTVDIPSTENNNISNYNELNNGFTNFSNKNGEKDVETIKSRNSVVNNSAADSSVSLKFKKEISVTIDSKDHNSAVEDKYSALRMLELPSSSSSSYDYSDTNNDDFGDFVTAVQPKLIGSTSLDFTSADAVFDSSTENSSDQELQLQLPTLIDSGDSSVASDTVSVKKLVPNGFTDYVSSLVIGSPTDSYHHDENDSGDNNNEDSLSDVQMKCLKACLDVLKKSYAIFSSASSQSVISEVLADKRGSDHLMCLLEVYKVSERIAQTITTNDKQLIPQVQSVWNTIVPYIDDSKHKQLEETVGMTCNLCKCDYGPSPVKYGTNTYHTPCANLYLNYVNSVLPQNSTTAS